MDTSVATKERFTCLCELLVCVDCGDRKMRHLGRRALALISSRLRTSFCMSVLGVCVKS